jgi:hypothetical protein
LQALQACFLRIRRSRGVQILEVFSKKHGLRNGRWIQLPRQVRKRSISSFLQASDFSTVLEIAHSFGKAGSEKEARMDKLELESNDDGGRRHRRG